VTGQSTRSKDERTDVASAALLVMSLLAVGKVVGVIDDLVKARVFGTGVELDAFVAAGGLPELLNTVISGGALAAPFIPVLASYLNRNDREGAWRLTSSVINLAFLATALLAAVVSGLSGDCTAGGRGRGVRPLVGQAFYRGGFLA